jgi:hypothetical protein
MADFFREVDEDYRRDRAIQFWTKYQYWFIAFAVLVIAGTGAWRYYEHIRAEAAEAAGAKYESAQQLSAEGKSIEAEAVFAALGKTAPKGYASLARLRAADELATRDPQAAIGVYDGLAGDPTYNDYFRDLARLRAALLSLDNSDPQQLEQRLTPLAARTFPYHDTILELQGLAALRRNDLEAAGRAFDAIAADPQTSSALRQRAEAFLGLVQAGNISPELPAPAAGKAPAAQAPGKAFEGTAQRGAPPAGAAPKN